MVATSSPGERPGETAKALRNFFVATTTGGNGRGASLREQQVALQSPIVACGRQISHNGSMARLENLLGAQALALTDRLLAAESGPQARTSASERAALVTLLAHPDHSVSWLGGVLGLTSSGITRLVDRLVASGWATRTAGSDARSRRVRLTRAGRNRARDVLQARSAAMAGALGALSQRDRSELERLLDLIVANLAETRRPAMQVCRLCDRSACASGGRECPLEHTATVEPAHD
jgi:DNA-binding MarR family transcriptional regulator